MLGMMNEDDLQTISTDDNFTTAAKSVRDLAQEEDKLLSKWSHSIIYSSLDQGIRILLHIPQMV